MRIAIADDESLARQRLVRLIENQTGFEIVAVCASAAELLSALDEEAIDLALLDVDMPTTDGLSLAKTLSMLQIPVIFVTAHPEHAVSAFDVGAIDYVVKPVDPARLSTALSRVASRAPVRQAPSGPIAVPGGRGVRLLHPDEILYAEVDGSGLAVHTAAGPIHSEWSLAELERRLPADRFVRVHRRTLVALSAIEWFEGRDGAHEVKLRSGARLSVSRSAGRALKRRFGV